MTPHLGISLTEPKEGPIFKIHRFKVFNREPLHLLEPHKRKRNRNFQINGDKPSEKIVVRVFMDEEMRIYKSRYYYLPGLDQETAFYLVMALLEKLKSQYMFAKAHYLKELKLWK